MSRACQNLPRFERRTMKGPAPSLEWCRAFFSIDYGYRFYTRCLSEAVIGKSFIYEFPGQVVFVGIELQGKGEIAWLLWKNKRTEPIT